MSKKKQKKEKKSEIVEVNGQIVMVDDLPEMKYTDILKLKAEVDDLNRRGKQKADLHSLLTRYLNHEVGKQIKAILGDRLGHNLNTENIPEIIKILLTEADRVQQYQLELLQMLKGIENCYGKSTKVQMIQEEQVEKLTEYRTFLENCIDGLAFIKEHFNEGEEKSDGISRESAS